MNRKNNQQKHNDHKYGISCPDCGQNMLQAQIKQHILKCGKYRSTYVSNIVRVIDYTNVTNLKFLVAQMQIAKQKLQNKLQELQPNTSNNIKQKQKRVSNNQIIDKNEIKSFSQLFKTQKQLKNQKLSNDKVTKQLYHEIKQKSNDKHQENDIMDQIFAGTVKKQINPIKAQQSNQNVDSEVNVCNKCLKSIQYGHFTYADVCMHLLCLVCLKKYIMNMYVLSQQSLKCPVEECVQKIPQLQIKQIVGQQQFQKLQKTRIQLILELIHCIKCQESFKFQKGKSYEAPKVNLQGNAISKFQAEHFANNRFLCPNCRTQQCMECHATPYHLGYSCHQYRRKKEMKKCRYCDGVIPPGYMSSVGISAFDDICQNEQCELLLHQACSKKLKCNHPCLGFIKQKQCPPCLWQQCTIKNTKNIQEKYFASDSSECPICFTQYTAAPCVISKCGHIFHMRCLRKTFEIKWVTPRIFFNFCKCPLCKKWIQVPSECPLTAKMRQFEEMYQSIKDKSIKRLKYQGAEKDSKVTDKNSIYYNKPEEYAIAIYAYFQCFKCKKPYFGGRKNCAEAMNQNKSDFDPKQLICPSCCPIAIKDCKKHGKQFISFKCKFCCSIAQFFCWGNTHFCSQCHKKQCSGTYISKLPISELPKCQGQDKCPAGGNHDGNGKQLCLGCMLCRNYKASVSQHDF